MITFPNPESPRWKTSQSGERSGSIIRTKNIDLSNEGVITLAKKALVQYSLADDAGFLSPTMIITDGTYVYAGTSGGHVFVISLTLDSFSILEASGTNQPTAGDDSDMVIFNALPHLSGGAKVGYLNDLGQGQAWHNPSPITDLSTSYPHPLHVRKRAQTLLVGDGSTLRQYSTGYSRDTANELVITSEYVITCVRTVGLSIYIGTRNIYGAEAKMFVWNGSGVASQAEYGCGADWIYSMCEYQSSIAIVTSAGQILRFNGGGFDEIENFPVFYTDNQWTSSAATSSLIGKVASRGMISVGNKLYLNVNGSVNSSEKAYPGTYIPQQPSGLWCLDPNVGLYHKAGYNYNSNYNLLPVSVDSSYLTFSTAHQAETGDAVLYVGSLTGLISGQTYFVIKESTTSVRLAVSPNDAMEGRWIPISGTISSEKFYFDRYESMGETSITSPGGICAFGKTYPNRFRGTDVMFGGSAIDETQTAKGVLMSLGMGRNRGSFVLSKILSSKVKDTFTNIRAIVDHFVTGTDTIVFKYRKLKKNGLPTALFFTGSATWTSTTTFTVDTTKKDFKSVSIGDEIEVVEGAGAGYTVHVTAIENSTSTYAVTVDEAMPVSSGSFDFIADNWAKVATFTKTTGNVASDGIASQNIDVSAKWIEVKVELRGRGVMIEETQIDNSTKQ